jgi:hypothetical protein
MIYIAHRGLYTGPNADLENHPKQINQAVEQGYDCEVDVWYKANKGWFLGHNGPDYAVGYDFIAQKGLWLHAKNLAALYYLTNTTLNYFWHESDTQVLTSHQYIWTYPDKPLSKRSIMLMPEWSDPELKSTLTVDCFGICSDWIEKIKSLRETD